MKFDLLSDDISTTSTPGIGLIVPFDFDLDDECWRWMPDGTCLFIARTHRAENPLITVEFAEEICSADVVAPAVGSLLATRPEAVAYACTAASFVRGKAGEKLLRSAILEAGAPQAATSSGALLMALDVLQITSLAIATPYNEVLTDLLGNYIEESGRKVVSRRFLDLEEGIARVKYSAVRRMAHEVDHPDAEAIFFSCTNLHTFDMIEELEKELGKPILSANQVTMWAAFKLGGLPMPKVNQRLFTLAA